MPRRPWNFFVAHPEFFKLWTGQAISSFGSAITTVAMPLAAVVVLHAASFQMGVLSALAVLPHLLFGLLAGVWVDRLPRRSLLVVADVGRALLLGTIPLLGVLGVLRIEHLYAVAFLTGVLTLLFDTASTTLVPALVGRENLVRANGAWLLSASVAGTVGPSLAGGLVQLLSAPVTIGFDAVSFLLSAGCSLLVRVAPSSSAAAGRRPIRLRAEIGEGLRTLFGSPILSPVVVSATVGALAGAMQGPLVVLYLVRDLRLSPTLVGLAITVAGAASVAGALLAPGYSRRMGLGRAYISGQLLASLAGVALAAASGSTALIAPFVVVGQLLRGLGPSLFSVPQTTLRQSLVPDHVLGRVNATWRFLVFGAQPLGALLGGALGAGLGLRATLVVSSLGMMVGFLWAVRSPLRSLRHVPMDAVG
jgi:MFS family permease